MSEHNEQLSPQDIKNIEEEAQNESKHKQSRRCMVCGKEAEYCMRGIPTNLYCKPCAQDYFKFLNYLESLK